MSNKPTVATSGLEFLDLEELYGLPPVDEPTYTRPGAPPSPELTPEPAPDFAPQPLVTDIPLIAGSQAQGDLLFARTDAAGPHWVQHIADATITLVASGNGHVLKARTAGRGRVYWAEVSCPGDQNTFGFIEVVGAPHEAVALVIQPGPDGTGTQGHNPLALLEGKYWVCQQTTVTPDLRVVRVVD